jgi:hypothetical protein
MNLSRSKFIKLLKTLPNKIKYIIHSGSSKALKTDRQVFLSPYGLGDTYILCLLSSEWERLHHVKIHFYIKSSHEFILKWFPNKEYTIVDVDNFPLYLLAALNSWKKLKPGHILIAHMRFHLSFRKSNKGFANGTQNLLDIYKNFFNIKTIGHKDDHVQFMQKALELNVTNLSNIDFSKLVFLSPTANTLKSSNHLFWTILKDEILKSGFHIIENADRIYLHTTEETKVLNLNLPDLVAMGLMCQFVITFRSGLSDLFQARNNKLFVIYPNELSLKQYSLKMMYQNIYSSEYLLNEKTDARLLAFEILNKIKSND